MKIVSLASILLPTASAYESAWASLITTENSKNAARPSGENSKTAAMASSTLKGEAKEEFISASGDRAMRLDGTTKRDEFTSASGNTIAMSACSYDCKHDWGKHNWGSADEICAKDYHIDCSPCDFCTGKKETAQLEAVAAKPMKVVEKKPVLDLFGGMCDPKECGEWDCKRFCFCFKMFPWYDTLFDRVGWSEEYCPSDEDTCDCTPVEVQAWDVPQKLDELKRDPFFPFDKLGPIWNPQMMFWDVIHPRIICGDWVPGPGDLHDMINEIRQAQKRDGENGFSIAFQLQAMENMLTHILDKPDAKMTVDNIAAMFKLLRPSQHIELNDMMSCSISGN